MIPRRLHFNSSRPSYPQSFRLLQLTTMSDLKSLLGKIEDDVSTKDPWETNSYRSTIAGFGTVTGKLLMNVGIGLLSGAGYMGIRTALARIARTHARHVRNEAWPGSELDERAYRDILEYQRFAYSFFQCPCPRSERMLG